ncbi:TonB-dependent receptor [Alteromonas flava]|uniref:TonB-dependent receptor n=1 Tax=Alteromonas flava TaxID=2048003 RepID=UPI000C28ED9D|nr:TonB-dependent receptor plug domain-containing protein [Alteromonas flava]
MKHFKLTPLAAFLITSNAQSFAYAQSDAAAGSKDAEIERIVVTSDFRQTALEQLAASATVLSSETIAQRQAQHIDALIGAIPNVNFASGASRGRFIQIRGIGERSQFSEPLNPSVNFTLDNIDLTGLFALAQPFDIAQVEVLRGPQATEFGLGALAGAVNMQSVQPGAEQVNQLLLSLASNNTWRAGVAVGGDLSPASGFRASWLEQRSDGDITNTFLNRADTDNINEQAGRLAYMLQLNDTHNLLVNYRYFDIDNGYDAFSLDNDRNTRSDEPGFDRNETHAVSVRLDSSTELADWLTILSVTESEMGYGYDEDWTFTGFHPNGYTSFDAYYRDVASRSLEIRATSKQPLLISEHAFDWVVGAVYRSRDEDLQREYTFADGPFSSAYSPTNFALYARVDTEINSKFGLQWGMRVEHSELDYADNTGFTDDGSDTLLGGKIALNYLLADGVIYGSLSRGYKTAGFNPDERVSENARLYAPEYNWNYEIGLKQRLPDTNASYRVALFYMDREDTQVADFDTLLRDNGSTDFIDIIGNADVGTNRGIEFEAQWQVTKHWGIDVAVGYLDATFAGYVTSNGERVNKQRQAQAPEFTANLASRFAFADNGLWRIELDFTDDYRFSDGHDVTSPGYALVDTSLEWQWQALQLQLWVKNLFDRDYYVRGFGGFSNDPRDGEFGYAQPEPYYQFGSERQLGATLNWYF